MKHLDRLAYLAYRAWRTLAPGYDYCRACREPYSPHAGRFRNLCRSCSSECFAMSAPVETHEVIRYQRPEPSVAPVRRIGGKSR